MEIGSEKEGIGETDGFEGNCVKSIETIKKLAAERTVVLLDYDTNEDIDDGKKPMSHAGLIKRYVMEH